MDAKNHVRTRGRLLAEGARFAGVGILSYALGIGLSAFFREIAGFAAERSVALALGILLVTNFFLARRYIFRATGNATHQFGRFLLASAAMRGVDYVLFFLLLRVLGLNYLLALTAAMAASTCLKFVFYRAFVFRPSRSAKHEPPPFERPMTTPAALSRVERPSADL